MNNAMLVKLEAIPDWVLLRGVVYPGKEKAPFVRSGKGARGAIAYKPEEDLLQCHECGEWHKGLAQHIRSHGISGREYKVKHGLRFATSLSGKTVTEKLQASSRRMAKARPASFWDSVRALPKKITGASRSSRYEERNESNSCHAQILARLDLIEKELGHAPSTPELAAKGLHAGSIADTFNVKSIREVYALLGMIPQRNGNRSYTREYIVEALRDYYVKHKRLPKVTDWGKGALPHVTYAQRMFGTRRAAFAAAGLGSVDNRATGSRNGTAKLTDVEIQEIRKSRSEGVLLKDLSVRFGVSGSTISTICLGGSWKHVQKNEADGVGLTA